jgi:hypothetical protein
MAHEVRQRGGVIGLSIFSGVMWGNAAPPHPAIVRFAAAGDPPPPGEGEVRHRLPYAIALPLQGRVKRG